MKAAALLLFLSVLLVLLLAACGGSVQPDDACAAHGGISRFVADPVHPDGQVAGIACRDGTYLGQPVPSR